MIISDLLKLFFFLGALPNIFQHPLCRSRLAHLHRCHRTATQDEPWQVCGSYLGRYGACLSLPLRLTTSHIDILYCHSGYCDTDMFKICINKETFTSSVDPNFEIRPLWNYGCSENTATHQNCHEFSFPSKFWVMCFWRIFPDSFASLG